ncbi:MAG: hypothetical protein HN995_08615 [Candidatus Marinimicrobia bacterium]|jgi:hypothetical protein|nr:hypothetical protein [Candidatus Neomarinimicrobiota bacterium]MBT3574918.1 hypothetical protein [Candidatus Neomarinimicrobiota bacterium]MBT3679699.1 hypothetical protein [Candidatus Neomarinimicrobiota bacterium]MBT3950802.1 hypothetical protein [Candidatus Neomarinimicrobiota bacterium]MBT4252393.1 hypothetical protein [Candidatus Neomarinimicrobiota bacterium]
MMSLTSLIGFEAQFQGDSLKGSLGEILSFGWDIQHPPGAQLTFSEIDLEGTGIEVLDRELVNIEGGSSLQFNTAIYDSVGIYVFPSSIVYLEDSNGLDSLFLRGPDLEIASILTPADTTFRDIKGIHAIRTPINLVYGLILVLVLAVVYLIFHLFRRRNTLKVQSKPLKIIVPPEEAHIIALRAFESLKRSKYVRFEQFKDFYSDLTHILKEYYENRFLVDALDQTTSEFLITMNSMVEFDTELINETQELLEKADIIKFAKAGSDELESGKALNLAIEIVKRTKIQSNQGDNT